MIAMSLPLPSDAMRDYFAALARGGRRELGFARVRPSDWREWQTQLRTALRELLAVDSYEPHEVRAEVVTEERCAGYRRQLLRVQGRDGAVIPAYWLIPDELAAPAGVVIALHGHGPGKVKPVAASQDYWGQPVDVSGERDYAVQAVRRGYLALAPDLRGFGEMMLPEALAAAKGDTCTEMAMRALMVGRSLVGMRILDMSSLIDWLVTQPQVDPGRLFCTGQSGGGTLTVWAAALEERIAAAVPSCGFCTFEHSIMAVHHCPCKYAAGVLDLCENYDLAGLIAPRPLLVVTGALDPIFPLEGVRSAYEQAREVYQAAGRPGNIELFVGGEGHRYYAERVWEFLGELGSRA
jgi:dienelactone hydrolase